MRRGYQVYKEVCAACHSMERICYRHLTGVTHTQEQAKAEAQAILVDDIDDKGKYLWKEFFFIFIWLSLTVFL